MARRKRESLRKRKNRFGKGTKGRKILVGALIALASFILLLVVGYYQLLSWLQGDGFRKNLSGDLCNRTQSENVDIPQNLTIHGSKVTLPEVRLERKGVLHAVVAKELATEVVRSALLSRELRFNNFTIGELTLSLDGSRSAEELPPVAEEEESFWDCFTPKKTTIPSIECKSATVDYLLHGKTYRLDDTKAFAQPIENGWQISFYDGTISTPLYYLEKCGLSTKEKASLTIFTGEDGHAVQYDLTNGRIQLDPGELTVNASMWAEDKTWNAKLGVSNANVERLLKGDWKKRLTGDLNGSELQLWGKRSKILGAKGRICLRKGELQLLPIIRDNLDSLKQIPFISQLNLEGRTDELTLQLKDSSCEVEYPYEYKPHNITGAWRFSKIDVRTKDDMLWMTGEVIIHPAEKVKTNGEVREVYPLGGSLHVGVSEKWLQEGGYANTPIAGAVLDKLFTKKENGYRWVTINLSGTLDEPGQDLTKRLKNLISLPSLFGFGGSPKEDAGDAADAPEGTPGAGPVIDVGQAAEQAAGQAADLATQAGNTVLEAGSAALRFGSSLLPGRSNDEKPQKKKKKTKKPANKD